MSAISQLYRVASGYIPLHQIGVTRQAKPPLDNCLDRVVCPRKRTGQVSFFPTEEDFNTGKSWVLSGREMRRDVPRHKSLLRCENV